MSTARGPREDRERRNSTSCLSLIRRRPADRFSSAQWLLVTAVASALTHGYARLIILRGDRAHHGVRAGLRLLLSEWPLVVATVPALVLLLGAGWGWWPSAGIEYVVFAVNVVLLFAWGLLAARAAGRTWGSALRIGTGSPGCPCSRTSWG